MNKEEIYNRINSQLLKQLEQGVLPWRKPWTEGVPKNYVSKREYQGINFLSLSCENVTSPYFLTFLQASEANLRIKKNSKGRLVVYYKIHSFIDSKTNEEITFPFIRYSYVFNLEDLEEYEYPKPNLKTGIELLSSISQTHKPDIRHNLTTAYYDRSNDFISVPSVKSFKNEEEYFSTLFHELIHWTGSGSRLNREKGSRFGDDSYCFEELVAEIGASYLSGLCGFNNLSNSSAYLDNWLKAAKKDSSYILTAAIYAQKASKFLLESSN